MDGCKADRGADPGALAEGTTPHGKDPDRRPAGAAAAHPGLRALLAGAFGLLGLVAALAVSLAVGDLADRRLRADIGAEFAATAERAADLLDRGLFERLRDIQVAASLDTMRDPTASPAARRAVLRRLHETYPDYAILFFIGPEGRMLVSSNGALEDVDVSRRDYVLAGRRAPSSARCTTPS